jgi:hypothetical protein
VEGTWNGGSNFHRNQYRIWSSLARRTKSSSLAQNELLTRLVDEEAPHELMRDGGEPPIYGGLRPDHRREIHATLNLTGKEKAGKKGVEERGGREGGIAKKRSEELWNKIQSER